ncbi:MAG: hypothetical protein HY897_16890, partial [Deltaproteobacteria bacterium]|nr:hypothetical protein [Deltaproteobacteria bacterium]
MRGDDETVAPGGDGGGGGNDGGSTDTGDTPDAGPSVTPKDDVKSASTEVDLPQGGALGEDDVEVSTPTGTTSGS